MKFSQKNRKGMVLMLTFIIMTTLTAIVVVFLYLTSTQTKGSGYDTASQKALWLAEAGVQKAIWYLGTPVANGGKGQAWTTTGETPVSLGDGTYTIDKVETWDFALAANGAIASGSAGVSGYPITNVNDGNDSTYWLAAGVATYPTNQQSIIIQFPYPLTIYKVGYSGVAGLYYPGNYNWKVSTDGVTYSGFGPHNPSGGFADTYIIWPPVYNVNYLLLTIYDSGPPSVPSNPVAVGTIQVLGNKITATGTVGGISRTIERTIVVKESTQTGYGLAEPGWKEI